MEAFGVSRFFWRFSNLGQFGKSCCNFFFFFPVHVCSSKVTLDQWFSIGEQVAPQGGISSLCFNMGKVDSYTTYMRNTDNRVDSYTTYMNYTDNKVDFYTTYMRNIDNHVKKTSKVPHLF